MEMTPPLRRTGIALVGDMPWGTHFCFFYETIQDLLDILVPYIKAGFEPEWDKDPYRVFVYTSLQERATQVSHAGVSGPPCWHLG